MKPAVYLIGCVFSLAVAGCAASGDPARQVDDQTAGRGATTATNVVIGEVQTRGDGGANDEFVELYNPTASAVTLDATWTLAARSASGTCANSRETVRFRFSGQTIPPGRHLLLGSAGYHGPVAADAKLGTGVTDAGSLVLRRGDAVVDALCFYADATTQDNLASCATPYVCRGDAVSNAPHDNKSSAASSRDVSLERRPGGALGNGQDSGDSAKDFASGPSNPQNLASPATPGGDVASTALACSSDGWCWEAPTPTANTLRAVVAFGDGGALAFGDHATTTRFAGGAVTATFGAPDLQIRAAWGERSDAIWGVGAGGRIAFFDGAAWHDVASPTTAELDAIWGAGDELWATGPDIAIHAKGGAWDVVKAGLNWGGFAVGGTSASDVYMAFGGRSTSAYRHWDGHAWTNGDISVGEGTEYVTDFVGLADGSLFAMVQNGGGHSLVVQRDASAPSGWRKVYDAFEQFTHLAATPGSRELWAVGPAGSAHFDGSAWQAADVPLGALAVAPTADGDVWIAGTDGAFARRHAGAWQQIGGLFNPYQPPNNHAIAATGPDDVWVGGGALRHFDGKAWSVAPQFTGSDFWVRYIVSVWAQGDEVWVVRRDDTNTTTSVWRKQGSGFTKMLDGAGATSVWGSGPDDVWVAGSPVLIHTGPNEAYWSNSLTHWNGTAWEVYDLPSPFPVEGAYGNPPTFTAMHGTSRDHVVIVGNVGVMEGGGSGSRSFFYVWDGASWTAHGTDLSVIDPTANSFNCVWTTGPRDTWACGGNYMYRFDGANITRTRLTTNETYLTGIHGLGAKDLTVVGGGRFASGADHGFVFHYDGKTWKEQDAGSSQWLSDVWTFPGGEAWSVGNAETLLHHE